MPLLGNLFKSQARRMTRSRFYVFLRCSVLRSSELEHLRWISAPAMGIAGLEDDFPVV